MARQKKNVEQEELLKAEAPVEQQEQQTEEPVLDVDKATPEQIEFAKMSFKKSFNELYSKWAEIEDEPADDEYIAQAKKDFDDAVAETQERKYELADEENALAAAELLKDWNRTANHWTKGSWRGVLMFDGVIDKRIAEIKENGGPLIVDYSVVVFLYNAMSEPAGSGFESAERMAKWENYNVETNESFSVEDDKDPVTYSGILEKIQEHVKYLDMNDKKLNLLRERYFTANAGLRTKLKISTLEEFVEYSNAVVNNGQPQQ